jgi:hypothetical protein
MQLSSHQPSHSVPRLDILTPGADRGAAPRALIIRRHIRTPIVHPTLRFTAEDFPREVRFHPDIERYRQAADRAICEVPSLKRNHFTIICPKFDE